MKNDNQNNSNDIGERNNPKKPDGSKTSKTRILLYIAGAFVVASVVLLECYFVSQHSYSFLLNRIANIYEEYTATPEELSLSEHHHNANDENPCW